MLASETGSVTDEYKFQSLNGDPRIVVTKRIALKGADGQAEYLVSTIHDITERKQSEARIAHLALHDPLTDLPNRALFNEHLAKTFDDASSGEASFAILCVDLDRFKEVNDVFGHSVGDQFLCEVARRITAACDGAFVARLGGDEFTIVSSAGPQPATAERCRTGRRGRCARVPPLQSVEQEEIGTTHERPRGKRLDDELARARLGVYALEDDLAL